MNESTSETGDSDEQVDSTVHFRKGRLIFKMPTPEHQEALFRRNFVIACHTCVCRPPPPPPTCVCHSW